jgi:hypothetical protein
MHVNSSRNITEAIVAHSRKNVTLADRQHGQESVQPVRPRSTPCRRCRVRGL